MSTNDVTQVLQEPLAQELLQAKFPARLSYTVADGSSRVIPIGFYWDGAQILLFTAPIAPKVKALRRDPRVALTIDTNAFPPHVLLIRGRATLETVDGVPDEYLEASKKTVPPEIFPQFEAQVRATYQKMVRIAITPTWAKVLDFETTAPDFVMELARQAQSRS
jgi:Pyridoxamine 5'-phosphate oxidase